MKEMRSWADNPGNIYYLEDCQILQGVAQDNGQDITLTEAAQIWEEYSESFEASWMGVPTNEDLVWDIISGYLGV